MKYLALDLGNVVCNVNFNLFIRHLSKTLNVSIDEVNYFLNRTQKLHDLGLTVMSDELRDHFKIRSSVIVDESLVLWNKTITINPIMKAFVNDLIHKRSVKVALLSNIGVEHSNVIPEVLSKDIFDHSIKFFSCDVGTRKPNYLYYKTFLDMYPEFKGCLYLDDRPENVAAGKIFGFDAKLFVLDDMKTIAALAKATSEIKRTYF